MIRFFLFFLIILTFSGCGLLKQSEEPAYYFKSREVYKDPMHSESCGPRALSKILKAFNKEIDTDSLSHSIQANFKWNTLLRGFLAIFINEAREITFQEEMLYMLEENGFKIKKVDCFEQLNEKTDIALILIKEEGRIAYHWMCFPIDKNILSFFGKDTIIKDIYLVLRKEE